MWCLLAPLRCSLLCAPSTATVNTPATPQPQTSAQRPRCLFKHQPHHHSNARNALWHCSIVVLFFSFSFGQPSRAQRPRPRDPIKKAHNTVTDSMRGTGDTENLR
ncbi:hypothetical protein DL93DRAFT_2084622 [Clavulina sp. PMI_390]|nr:hypothetical protein DL93DRAFT_2084622 [Clavulina sp. PMI_390]